MSRSDSPGFLSPGSGASGRGGTRTMAPAVRRVAALGRAAGDPALARAPSIRIWPERTSFWIWTWFRCGQRRLNQRSRRTPSSPAPTARVRTSFMGQPLLRHAGAVGNDRGGGTIPLHSELYLTAQGEA